MILFKRVRDPYGWLSNMSPHPVGEYRTAEAYFQAQRFSDLGIQKEIRDCTSPMAAKMTAKRHARRMVIIPRSEEDLELMRLTVRLKVGQHSDLLRMLLATSNQILVEDVSSRPNESGLFWGAILQSDGTLNGLNWLRRIWMDLRDELQGGAHVNR